MFAVQLRLSFVSFLIRFLMDIFYILDIYVESGKSRTFFYFDKFRNTSLNLRLVTLSVGNYAVGLRAWFASSYEIYLRKPILIP